MSDTKQAILDLGEMLIRTKGFNDFSYKDISTPLNIKNAAVHYYFPTKTDLGVAIIKKELHAFSLHIKTWEDLPENEQFIRYCKVCTDNQYQGWVCLMGALSPSYDYLPVQMQQELKNFGDELLSWLTDCLQKGKQKKLFQFREEPNVKATLIMSALISSLLFNKVMGPEVFSSIFKAVIESV